MNERSLTIILEAITQVGSAIHALNARLDNSLVTQSKVNEKIFARFDKESAKQHAINEKVFARFDKVSAKQHAINKEILSRLEKQLTDQQAINNSVFARFEQVSNTQTELSQLILSIVGDEHAKSEATTKARLTKHNSRIKRLEAIVLPKPSKPVTDVAV